MRIETNLARKAAEVETVAAPGIQNNVALARANYLRDPAQQRPRYATIVQSPPRCHGIRGIARILGSPILGLQQVDIPAACDVKRMAAGANYSLLFACQGKVAAPYGAKKHIRL